MRKKFSMFKDPGSVGLQTDAMHEKWTTLYLIVELNK